MEREPLDLVTEHNAGGHQELGKVAHVDALLLVLLEVDATVGEEINGVLGVHVLPVDTGGGGGLERHSRLL